MRPGCAEECEALQKAVYHSRMFLKVVAAAILCTAVCPLGGQQRAPLPSSPSAPATASSGALLFRMQADCGCIRTRKATATIQSVKVVEGPEGQRTTYQSFRLRTEPDIEVFRVPVEWVEQGESNAWWNYGIANEGDFNGDGQPDYAWYGGDESGGVLLLFLSGPYGYVQIDVLKTIEKAWEKRLHQPAPDFADPESTDWAIEAIRIRKEDAGLVLAVVAVDHPDASRRKQSDLRLEIAEAEFVH